MKKTKNIPVYNRATLSRRQRRGKMYYRFTMVETRDCKIRSHVSTFVTRYLRQIHVLFLEGLQARPREQQESLSDKRKNDIFKLLFLNASCFRARHVYDFSIFIGPHIDDNSGLLFPCAAGKKK